MKIPKSTDLALKCAAGLHARFCALQKSRERGDMPGWVLIAVVTAIIAGLILTFMQNSFFDGFKKAVMKVVNQGG